MKTVEIVFDGCKLLVPLVEGEPLQMPHDSFDDFRGYCGAGQGIGDALVPETFWGLRMSVGCFIHDCCWAISEASWKDFHHSNSVFLHNLNSIVETQSKWLKHLRLYRCVTYYNAVDTIGAAIFWNMKGRTAP